MLHLLLCDDEMQWCEIIKEYIRTFCEKNKIVYQLISFGQDNLEQVRGDVKRSN